MFPALTNNRVTRLRFVERRTIAVMKQIVNLSITIARIWNHNPPIMSCICYYKEKWSVKCHYMSESVKITHCSRQELSSKESSPCKSNADPTVNNISGEPRTKWKIQCVQHYRVKQLINVGKNPQFLQKITNASFFKTMHFHFPI